MLPSKQRLSSYLIRPSSSAPSFSLSRTSRFTCTGTIDAFATAVQRTTAIRSISYMGRRLAIGTPTHRCSCNVAATAVQPSSSVTPASSKSAKIYMVASRCFSSAASSSPSTPLSHPSSTSTILDGKATSEAIIDDIGDALRSIRSMQPSMRPPGLAVLIASTSRDSERYVQMKQTTAERIGFESRTYAFDSSTVTEEEMLRCLDALNKDPSIDGVLIQLPLPSHLNTARLLHAVEPSKDVDGFHPINMGRLALSASSSDERHKNKTKEKSVLTCSSNGDDRVSSGGGERWREVSQAKSLQQAIDILKLEDTVHHIPCTPKACVELLDRYNISLSGLHVAVLGRSSSVGLPLTLLMMSRSATVTNIDQSMDEMEAKRICQEADVVVAAIGRAEYVRGDWLKVGAIVIDVGINFIPKTHPLTGRAALLENELDARDSLRLVGDVHFDECCQVAGYITPVPGGVGPMTVAMLMSNTMRAYLRNIASIK